eukprot:CAMPEP_0178379808 /NCGR_PEP_ID=MMETSP0689_2-20121128/5137_1 /TAXON_ID=160604 /ORGANISM="Amphidinium massartii, Strain CS-259" /LENGTH=135 /DNA_ID=CAMNT_0019999929 /DNA_START=442 /DNA_END=850 /DNA_ORIENTATION=+
MHKAFQTRRRLCCPGFRADSLCGPPPVVGCEDNDAVTANYADGCHSHEKDEMDIGPRFGFSPLSCEDDPYQATELQQVQDQHKLNKKPWQSLRHGVAAILSKQLVKLNQRQAGSVHDMEARLPTSTSTIDVKAVR